MMLVLSIVDIGEPATAVGACTDDWDGTYRTVITEGDDMRFEDSYRDECVVAPPATPVSAQPTFTG